MKTDVLTPQAVFYLPQHLVVPLFQRPYVWDEAEQWMPLWQDIARLAEIRIRDPYSQPTHFLGAVVLQAIDGQQGAVPSKNVIDGQQRLTTLQLFVDAAAATFEAREFDGLADQLNDLTHNRAYGGVVEASLKLSHTNQDGQAFREVMNAEAPVTYEALNHAGSRITRAHEFFAARVDDWLGAAEDARDRADALAQAVSQGLQLVVIDLLAQENSQEIFETLNARGTPLTAADLIKNFVFQRLDAEGADTHRAYAEDWPFESKFWEKEVSVGRVSMSRSSLFLSQWLVSQLGEEVSPRQTFIRFKTYVDHEANTKMAELLLAIKAQAELYRSWTEHATESSRILTRPEMAFYRMTAGGVELLKPAIIWLYDPALGIPADVADRVLSMLESWMVRRQILRLTSADLGRIVAEIIKIYRTSDPADLADSVEHHLSRLNVASNYWPGDDEVRAHLVTEQSYRRYPRGRMRLYLEAVEDHLRAKHDYPQVARLGYPIEHVLPQKWETNWPVDGLEAELARGEHVHRLGNLTLLTTSLNANVSNGAWPTKREKIVANDVMLLNRYFTDRESWDESSIDARTTLLTDLILQVWPVPDGHTGSISDSSTKENAWVEVKHLVAAGLLEPGTALLSRPGKWAGTEAIVLADGRIAIGDKVYASPSSAGYHAKGGKAANGWVFWHLDDGRRLADVRAQFRGGKSDRPSGFDWSRLHEILAALPAGSWTSYSELADAIGTAPQPLGTHITRCQQCSHPWRVLTHDGRVASGFAWSDPDDTRIPADLLAEEGVHLQDGVADPGLRLDSDGLTALIDIDN
ncbi:GmrSD restriction endonuclease domain-containing protein [Nocardioides sp. GXZ039]|uniref:GmrSD restriction endonuclease domain-containing protein n=1 Tax=Nocardioides sp. GXZ039 TaxID=3136018 RepID=UPI0030F430C2